MKDKEQKFWVMGNGEYEKAFKTFIEAQEYAEIKRKKYPKYNFEVKIV